jgi:hypothetical protein
VSTRVLARAVSARGIADRVGLAAVLAAGSVTPV